MDGFMEVIRSRHALRSAILECEAYGAHYPASNVHWNRLKVICVMAEQGRRNESVEELSSALDELSLLMHELKESGISGPPVRAAQVVQNGLSEMIGALGNLESMDPFDDTHSASETSKNDSFDSGSGSNKENSSVCPSPGES